MKEKEERKTVTVQINKELLHDAVERFNKAEFKNKFLKPYTQRDVVHIALAKMIHELGG